MICLAYIGYYIFSPFLLQNKAEYIFYSLSIAKCNKCYQLALHYSESDAFLLPGDDLKNTHKPYIVTIMCLLSSLFFFIQLSYSRDSFGYSNSWILARRDS